MLSIIFCREMHVSDITLDSEEDDTDAKARRVVRNNNFTGQTNALDVDKHM